MAVVNLWLADGEGYELGSHLVTAGAPAVAFSGLRSAADAARSRGAGLVTHLAEPAGLDEGLAAGELDGRPRWDHAGDPGMIRPPMTFDPPAECSVCRTSTGRLTYVGHKALTGAVRRPGSTPDQQAIAYAVTWRCEACGREFTLAVPAIE